MSGKYSRTYSRKKAPVAPPISQFDRLVSETDKNSHHPVATKTAGHIGKWGVTSFTSLRCITESSGKDDYNKKHLSSNISAGESNCSSQPEVAPCNPAIPKRRKFFKSRDSNNSSISSSYSANQPSTENLNPDFSAQAFERSVEDATLHSSRNSFTTTQTKCSNLNSNSSNEKVGGCGIKLKIFKSRNQDLNSSDTYSSSVQLPSDDSGSSSSNSSSIANSPRSDLTPNDPSTELIKKGNDYSEDTKIGLKENVPSLAKQQTASREVIDDSSVPSLGSQSTLEELDDFPARNILQLHSHSEQSSKEVLSSTLKQARSKKKQEPFSGMDDMSGSSSKSDSGISVSKSRESSAKKLSLFSSDFDDVIDRTSIDYSSSTNSQTLSNIDLHDNDNVSQSSSVISLSLKSDALVPSSSLPMTGDSESCISHSFNKKNSIFKSRQAAGDPKKRATYKHKWHGHDEKEEIIKKAKVSESTSQPSSSLNSDPFAFDSIPLTRVQTWPTMEQTFVSSLLEEPLVTRVKCPKEAKKYYTVIKNVKKTHQLQESGEFQEFNDDVEYFLDALRSSNSVSTRCLAAFNLAHKCMTPAFRMHLRAHGTVIKFFKALSDAPSHPQLAECAAMVMFALSQDRLNMDLDRDSLELMLNLLDTDTSVSDMDGVVLADHSAKIKSLCEELQLKGHAKHLKLDKITAASLAMETLLSLTSKRAGEWFKEELRDLGGVDHLVRTITSCSTLFRPDVPHSWSPHLIEKLSKIDRCLKVLENVTLQNEVNLEYLLNVNDGDFGCTLMKVFKLCRTELPFHPENSPSQESTGVEQNAAASKVIVATLITSLKVLINLTHGSCKEALGSKVLGADDEVYNISLYCLLMLPTYLNHEAKFEMQVLACCLLLNLVENSTENRARLMRIYSPIEDDADNDDIFTERPRESAMASLMTLFYTNEESARVQEAHTDQIIDEDLAQPPHQEAPAKEEEKKDDDIEETVARLLQKAGRHMEDTLIAAYTALIAGFCLLDNEEFEKKIRCLQPEGHFKTMVAVLKKFLRFMNLTATTSLLRRMKPTERVVKHMEQLDRSPKEEEEERRKRQEKEEAAQAMADDAFGF